jgi:hypothetical protein
MRNARNRFTTAYGRAISAGTVTRKSHAVRTSIRTSSHHRPLPFELQVHPKALTPTPKHPDCKRVLKPHGGRGITLARSFSRKELLAGAGLSSIGRYILRSGSTELGRLGSLTEAMAWKAAAMAHGVWCDVWEDTENG